MYGNKNEKIVEKSVCGEKEGKQQPLATSLGSRKKKEKEENERLLPKSDEIKSSVSSAVFFLAVGFLN